MIIINIMNLSENLNLPEVLKPYQEAIAKTIKPYIRINPNPNPTQLWQSKFGGYPYLPKNINYPSNSEGKFLQLLAQINFREIPPLENFPTQGILQFYIDGNDDLYGLDFDNPTNQDGFKVLYFEKIEEKDDNLVTDFSFLSSQEKDPAYDSPITIIDETFEQYFPNFKDDNLRDSKNHRFCRLA